MWFVPLILLRGSKLSVGPVVSFTASSVTLTESFPAVSVTIGLRVTATVGLGA